MNTYCRAQPWFGTVVTVSVRAPDAAAARCAIDAAFACCAAVHRALSAHASDSDVARISRAASGDVLEVDSHTTAVIALSIRWRAASGGLFDPAVGAALARAGRRPGLRVGSLRYGSGFATGRAGAAGPSGLRALRVLDATRVHVLAPVALDFGGIAKGYAVDCAVQAARAAGAVAVMVNAGGDARASGPWSWPIARRLPAAPTRVQRVGRLRDAAVASSGLYLEASRCAGRALTDIHRPGRGALRVRARGCSVQAARAADADVLAKVVLLRARAPRSLLWASQARARLH